jgi:GntR family transcriptional repressor for pyruvate dehydrogenase complex
MVGGGRGALAFLEPIETKARGLAVQDALADMIERGGLKVGDRLPPEITLAEHLGVGRSTIREALNRWEGLGLIRRKRGAGTFLSARVPSSKGLVPMMIRLEGEALLRFLEVRRALENVAVRKAAQNATA